MNKLYSISFIYWIIRDTGKPGEKVVSVGFMRQTGYPWKHGKGVQLRLGKYIFQFGVCRSNSEIKEEEDGLLYSMQGRLLNEKPKDIGNW